MTDVTLRIAVEADAPRLHAALERLSADLGDTHGADLGTLRRAGWGESPAFRAVLAERGDSVTGVALYSPCFSTVRGGAGIYVSDLWVAPEGRGQRLGRRLLAAAWKDAKAVWAARFVKLGVYTHSDGARRFYDRLGFAPIADQTDMVLGPAGCAALEGKR